MKPGAGTLFHVMEHLLLAGAVTVLALLLTAGFWLQSTDYPAQSDAMVVLAGNFNRPAYAAELYQLGLAKKIHIARTARLPGEKVLDDNGIEFPRRERLYRAILVKRGIPDDAISFFGENLDSTVAEAEALAGELKGKTGSLMVVTSPYHARRARMLFSRALPGWDVRVVGVPSERLPGAWWSERHSARAVLAELPKTVFYMLGGRFRPVQASN
uniref:YdcF family protein n=1 Tax=Fundidesulfovibrio putealis TaxID=270496 RepID=A0A7C4AGR2_9BACT